jgi:hypothetical protein
VTPVKSQGKCGSCYTFAAVGLQFGATLKFIYEFFHQTGALEAAYRQKYGQLVPLSEQDFVDCTTSYGNVGCGGGSAEANFHYAHDVIAAGSSNVAAVRQFGVNTEAAYPYTGKVLTGTKF